MHNGAAMERYEGTPQGGPLSLLLANVLLDEVDKELARRGHRFVRYADDCNVYVRSQKAGERVLRGMRKLYERLHLKVNEAKTAVTSAFGRKFLGYSLWLNPWGNVRRAVAGEAIKSFKRRIRQITRRTRGRSVVCLKWPTTCGVTCRAGRRTSGWHRLRGSSVAWTNGCVVACVRYSSSTGDGEKQHTGSCARWVRSKFKPPKWPRVLVAGGIPASASYTSSCRSPTSTVSAFLGSHEPQLLEKPGADPHAGWCGRGRSGPLIAPLPISVGSSNSSISETRYSKRFRESLQPDVFAGLLPLFQGSVCRAGTMSFSGR